MLTAIDSSVLIALRNQEPSFEAWRALLFQASTEGELVICPIVFAETMADAPGPAEALETMTRLGIHYDPIHPEAAHLAGQILADYRRGGGPRQHLIPDFLIGAHAQTQADRLAATDRGYLRRYFPGLTLLSPTP